MIEDPIDASPAKNRLSSRDLALIASFAALVAVLGLPGGIYVGGGAVPIVLQNVGMMLAGSILGWKRGALSLVAFLVLVAAGLPLLSGGRGGPGVFVGPSAGYLIAYPVGAAVIGWLVQQRLPAYKMWWGALANLVGGIGVVYLMGIPVLAWVTNISLPLAAKGSLVFLPGDLFKVAVATVVASAVHRAYPGITAGSRIKDRDRVSAR